MFISSTGMKENLFQERNMAANNYFAFTHSSTQYGAENHTQ